MQEQLRTYIKKIRLKRNLSQEHMAKEMGYKSKTSYNLLENGPSIITTEQLKRITEILTFSEKELEELWKVFFDKKVHENQTFMNEN